jgi:hypothetical protein
VPCFLAVGGVVIVAWLIACWYANGMRATLLAGPRYYQVRADPSAGPLPPGVHVVRGDSPGGALKSAGAAPIIAVPDNLAVGPSSRSPKLHPKIRERYWRAEYASARRGAVLEDDLGDLVTLLGAPALVDQISKSGATPLRLWGSGFWSDLLFLGWLFDAVRDGDGEWKNATLAGDLHATMPLGWLNPEQLYPLGRDARQVSPQLRQAFIEVWRAFTEPTPKRLEELRRAPPEPLPTFVEGLAGYAALLPRRFARSRRLRLSAVDEVLFRLIPSSRRVRFPDLFKGSSPARARWPKAGLFSMLAYFGEVFIETRIASWSSGPAPAIEQFELTGMAEGPYTTAWRLTERGRRLLAQGLDGADDCPEQLVGGYRPGRVETWCCSVTAAGWRLERCA